MKKQFFAAITLAAIATVGWSGRATAAFKPMPSYAATVVLHRATDPADGSPCNGVDTCAITVTLRGVSRDSARVTVTDDGHLALRTSFIIWIGGTVRNGTPTRRYVASFQAPRFGYGTWSVTAAPIRFDRREHETPTKVLVHSDTQPPWYDVNTHADLVQVP